MRKRSRGWKCRSADFDETCSRSLPLPNVLRRGAGGGGWGSIWSLWNITNLAFEGEVWIGTHRLELARIRARA